MLFILFKNIQPFAAIGIAGLVTAGASTILNKINALINSRSGHISYGYCAKDDDERVDVIDDSGKVVGTSYGNNPSEHLRPEIDELKKTS